jgi:O-antigen/teichoic acid export membrane protein
MSEAVSSSLRTAVKGTVFVLAGMIASQALWFVTRLLIVRNLSTEDLGTYSLVVGIVSIVSFLASMGLWEGSSRYISIFLGQGRKEDADAVHRSSLMIGAIVGAMTFAAMFLLSGFLSNYIFYKPELSMPLRVISFFIPVFVMAYSLAAVLRGYGKMGPRVYFMDIGQPLFFLIFFCVVLFLGLPFISVIYAYVLSMAAVFLLIAGYGYQKTGISPFAFTRGGHVRELLRFSIPVMIIDAMSLIFRWADTLMLGRYGSSEEVGIYSVSVSLAVFLSLPLLALDAVYMPIAGDFYAKNLLSDLSRTYKVLTRWIFALTLPVFFILFFFPEMTITFLFGNRFSDAVLPLRVLSIGYLIFAFLGANAMLLLVLGHSGTVMKVFTAGTVLNILLNYILIKHAGLGMLGAAVASMASVSTISIVGSYILYRMSGIHPLAPGYLKPVIGSAIIGLIIYAAAKNLPLYSWILPVYFILYICGYVASLVLTRSLEAEDIFLIKKIMERAGVAPEAAQRIMGKLPKGKAGATDIR